MTDIGPFASPRTDVKQEDCYFYHTMELPGVGELQGDWDLREELDNYLGNYDFTGKRVLDVGCASGCLSFAMEARGAEVVSFDMKDGSQWNLVPHAELQPDWDTIVSNSIAAHRKLQNAYWFAHEKLQSKNRVYYGDVYNLPTELGTFDLVFLGMILGHLRDPFQALYSASRLCKGEIMVTNQWVPSKKKRFRLASDKVQSAYFMPSRSNREFQAWWSLSDHCIEGMLEILGFDAIKSVHSNPQCRVQGRVQKERCVSTLVQRKRGKVEIELKSAPQKAG